MVGDSLREGCDQAIFASRIAQMIGTPSRLTVSGLHRGSEHWKDQTLGAATAPSVKGSQVPAWTCQNFRSLRTPLVEGQASASRSADSTSDGSHWASVTTSQGQWQDNGFDRGAKLSEICQVLDDEASGAE